MIHIDNSKFGKGIFASEDILRNTIIIPLTGNLIKYVETLSMGANECYPIQIDRDTYILPNEPFKFINHSCEPNCGLTPNLELIAIREIVKGEELFWDYSTSMMEKSWKMQCHCGSQNCREIIEDFDLLPHDIQKYYLNYNIVQNFIIIDLYGQYNSDGNS